MSIITKVAEKSRSSAASSPEFVEVKVYDISKKAKVKKRLPGASELEYIGPDEATGVYRRNRSNIRSHQEASSHNFRAGTFHKGQLTKHSQPYVVKRSPADGGDGKIEAELGKNDNSRFTNISERKPAARNHEFLRPSANDDEKLLSVQSLRATLNSDVIKATKDAKQLNKINNPANGSCSNDSVKVESGASGVVTQNKGTQELSFPNTNNRIEFPTDKYCVLTKPISRAKTEVGLRRQNIGTETRRAKSCMAQRTQTAGNQTSDQVKSYRERFEKVVSVYLDQEWRRARRKRLQKIAQQIKMKHKLQTICENRRKSARAKKSWKRQQEQLLHVRSKHWSAKERRVATQHVKLKFIGRQDEDRDVYGLPSNAQVGRLALTS